MTQPTAGFNIETILCSLGSLRIWDLGGREELKPLWKAEYKEKQGVIYVVDSEDRQRINLVKEDIQDIVNSKELKGLPLLVMANKADLPGKMKITEIVDKLGLKQLRRTHWLVKESSALTG